MPHLARQQRSDDEEYQGSSTNLVDLPPRGMFSERKARFLALETNTELPTSGVEEKAERHLSRSVPVSTESTPVQTSHQSRLRSGFKCIKHIS